MTSSIRLCGLGSVELRGDGGEVRSVLAQPKRTALLAYLAFARPRGYHRRDTLFALFWPEMDADRARGALNTAVYHLRRSLGAGVLVNRGDDEIGIAPGAVWCDVAAFEDALDEGRAGDALDLYRGALLEGFFIAEAGGFERWLDGRRRDLHERARAAARALADGAERSGDGQAAIHWRRRALALAPDDEGALRRLLAALGAAGDVAGARREYEAFARALDADVGRAPSPETREVMRALEAPSVRPDARAVELAPAPVRTAAERAVEADSEGAGGEERVPAHPAAPAPAEAPPASPSRAPAPPPAARRRSRRWLAGAAGLAVAAALGGVAWNRAGPVPGAVLVLPFAGQAPGVNADSIAAHVVEAMSADSSIDAETAPGAEDDPERARGRARRARTEYVVVGRVEASGGGVRVRAALFDGTAGADPLTRAEVEGRPGEAAALARSVVGQLLAGRPYSRNDEIVRAQGLDGLALPAAAAYHEGTRLLAAGHAADALARLRGAVEADTSFTLGYLRMSMAAHWVGEDDMAAWSARQAARRAGTLTRPDRLRVLAWNQYLSGGDPAAAETLYRALLAYDPMDVEGWYGLGELLFHWFPAMGRPATEARGAFERVVRAQPGRVDALVHLARIAALAGDAAAVDSLAAAALGRAPDEAQAAEMRMLRRLAGTAGAGQAFADGEGIARSRATLAAAVSADPAHAAREAAALARPGASPGDRATAAVLAASLAARRGRPADAASAVREAGRVSPARAAELRAMLATLPWSAPPRAELERARAALVDTRGDVPVGTSDDFLAADAIYPPRRLLLLGLLELRLGNAAAATRHERELRGFRGQTFRDGNFAAAYARVLRAEVERAAGQPGRALAALGPARALPDSLLPPLLSYPAAHGRWLRAELLRETGRHEAALDVYASFPDPAAYDVAYVSVAHLRRAQIHERRGEAAAARGLYERALLAWRDADPSHARFVREAGAGLARVGGAR